MDFSAGQPERVFSLLIFTFITFYSCSALATTFEISRQDFRKIQAVLQAEGLYTSEVDGRWGRRSRAAIRAFIEKHNLHQTQGVIYRDGKFITDEVFLLALFPEARKTRQAAEHSPATVNLVASAINDKLSDLFGKVSSNTSRLDSVREELKTITEDRRVFDERLSSLTSGLYQTMFGTVITAILAAVAGAYIVIKQMKKGVKTQITKQVEDFEERIKSHEDKTKKNLKGAEERIKSHEDETKKNLEEVKEISSKAHELAAEVNRKWKKLFRDDGDKGE